MKELRIGIVGCGEQATGNLLPSLLGITQANLVATCDIDLTKAAFAAGKYGALNYYTDFRSLIEKESIDGLILCGPPQMHKNIAEYALKRGINVFVEKPPTVYTKELVSLAKLAKKKGLVTGVGHNFRYSKSYDVLKKFASTEFFGNPVRFDLWFTSSKPKFPLWGLKSPIRSFLLAMAIHPIDLILEQFGKPDKLSVFVHKGIPDELLISVVFCFPGNKIATLTTGNSSLHFQVQIRLVSDNAKVLELDSLWNLTYHGFDTKMESILQQVSNRWSLIWSPSPVDSGYTRSGYLGELQAFVNAVLKGESFSPSFEDEIKVYQTIDEIENQFVKEILG
jgi:predicted dehydrogenase